MASRATFPLLLLAIAAVLLLSASQATATRGSHNLCSQTAYPGLCRPLVKKMINDPLGATQTTVTDLMAKTREARDSAAKYKKGNPAIGICYSSFGDAIYNLEKALKSIKARNKKTLNINLTAVVSDYGACVDAFIESHQVNFLQNLADELRKMGSNCLTLSTMIR